MKMSADQIAQATKRINDVWKQACEMYNITHKIEDISFNLRGKSAGTAHARINRLTREAWDFRLRFNQEAFCLDWEGMMNDTIPHEVAHLVCYARPDLGNNHNSGWKRVTRSLGGSGDRCHRLKLTPARRTVTHWYRATCGTVVPVSSVMHGKIQRGSTRIIRRTKGLIKACHYQGTQEPGVERTAVAAAAQQEPKQPKQEPKAKSAVNNKPAGKVTVKTRNGRVTVSSQVEQLIAGELDRTEDELITLVVDSGIIKTRSKARGYVKAIVKRLSK